VRAKQRSSHCTIGSQLSSCQTVAVQAALAASSAANSVEVGNDNLQGPQHFNTCTLQSPQQSACVCVYTLRSPGTPLLVKCYQYVCTLCSLHTPLLVKSLVNIDFAHHNFCFSAPDIWNSLPKTAINSLSPTVFMSHLKMFLFNAASSYQPASEVTTT